MRRPDARTLYGRGDGGGWVHPGPASPASDRGRIAAPAKAARTLPHRRAQVQAYACLMGREAFPASLT
jgi:hypothetical protein